MSHAPGHGSGDQGAAHGGAVFQLLAEREDRADIEDADAAWDEPGDSIPLAELIAELG